MSQILLNRTSACLVCFLHDDDYIHSKLVTFTLRSFTVLYEDKTNVIPLFPAGTVPFHLRSDAVVP